MLANSAAVSLPDEGSAHAPNTGQRALVDRAVSMLRPLIESIIDDQSASFDRALHIVVMDPMTRPGAAFGEAVLASYDFGNSGKVPVDYAHYARDKARHSFREHADTSELRDRLTGVHVDGERPLIGGVYRNGWTIGVSGAQPWVDEAIGNMLGDLLRALALQGLLTEK
jgi:hypothetical protein